MSKGATTEVAIVDYGMGNLFSVSQACEQAGLSWSITSSSQDLLLSDAVILPGVGAFGDAMETLSKLDLVSVLRDIAASSKPFIGICLGMQLMMTESHEFGSHRGLGIIEGEVLRLQESVQESRVMKIPQIGWNQINLVGSSRDEENLETRSEALDSPLLEGISDGEYMYFVHSFYSKLSEPSLIASTTRYAGIEFCSSVRIGNLFACQFHPERSGPRGLQVYKNLAKLIKTAENTEMVKE